MARLLLINPNTSTETTAKMVEIARAAAPNWLCLEGLTLSVGAPLIADTAALAAAADSVAALPDKAFEGFDAVIVGAFGDPGREILEGRLGLKPVVGIGQASMARAAAVSRGCFSIATTTPDLRASIRQLADSYGCSGSLRCVHTPPDSSDASKLMADARATEEVLASLVQRAIHEDGAKAVIIGGGPLAIAARALALRFPSCPIVEPIPTAVELVAQQLTPEWARWGLPAPMRGIMRQALSTQRLIRRKPSTVPPPPWVTCATTLLQMLLLCTCLPALRLLLLMAWALPVWVGAFYLLPRPWPNLSPMLLLSVGAAYRALSLNDWTGWMLLAVSVIAGFLLNLVLGGTWDTIEPLLARFVHAAR